MPWTTSAGAAQLTRGAAVEQKTWSWEQLKPCVLEAEHKTLHAASTLRAGAKLGKEAEEGERTE